jgi:DNA repair protein RadC
MAVLRSFLENTMELESMSRQALVERLLTLSPGKRAVLGTSEPDGAWTLCQTDRLAQILAAAKELLLRDLRRELSDSTLMDSPRALRDWLRLRCADLEHEVFMVVYLDARHRILDMETMFRGSSTQATVYPREVVKAALARNAVAVAFAHNHPSGCAEPSRADEHLTSTLKSALALVDVRCLDHFIVAGDQLTSMAERGLM